MAKTAAERMEISRARRRGEIPLPPSCSVCGKPLKDSGAGRAMAAGLCHTHWQETPEGKAFALERRRLRREAQIGPRPWRYFGAIPGEPEEGPFNRLRLAVSSSYAGKGKPRGTVWIVWSDGVVTEHTGIRQADVGEPLRDAGAQVDRSDLYAMARDIPAMTERVRHYGHGDVYLID